MEQHALAILQQKQSDLWNWRDTRRIQGSGKQAGKFQAAAPKLLYFLIVESQKFGGDVLDHFWKQLGACDKNLKENIECLKQEHFVSGQKSFDALFRGLDPKNVNFNPVLDMAVEYFTHLGVAFMNLGGRESESGANTEVSVSDVVNEETDKLLQQVSGEGNFGKRKQALFKALLFKRDGNSCLLNHTGFLPFDNRGVDPDLAHIIPNSVYGKPDTLKCIAMFTGAAATDEVVHHLNNIGNVMNMEHNTHSAYVNLDWGIEAKEEGGEVKYFFRRVPTDPDPHYRGPGYIALREGDKIRFGKGPEGKELDNGPTPILCNLQLAVARVLKMSGAADIILEWRDYVDDDGCDPHFITSRASCDMVDAKLFLSGRAVVA